MSSPDPVFALAAEVANSPFDLCWCGDYRHQHDQRGCLVCRASRHPWDNCKSFKLHERYSAARMRKALEEKATTDRQGGADR